MSDDAVGALTILFAFVAGFWNGWVWRYLIARRRVDQMQHSDGSEGA